MLEIINERKSQKRKFKTQKEQRCCMAGWLPGSRIKLSEIEIEGEES